MMAVFTLGYRSEIHDVLSIAFAIEEYDTKKEVWLSDGLIYNTWKSYFRLSR
jgi:hypothetical protein